MGLATLKFRLVPVSVADVPQALFQRRIDKNKVVADLVPARFQQNSRVQNDGDNADNLSSVFNLPSDFLTNVWVNDGFEVESVLFVIWVGSENESAECWSMNLASGIKNGISKSAAKG